jgi:serine/threonine protein kinase/tetratricopeptide (TPR) repeat protein
MAGIYILENAQIVGPFEEAQLPGLIRGARLQPATYCWRTGLPAWQPAAALWPTLFTNPLPSEPPPATGERSDATRPETPVPPPDPFEASTMPLASQPAGMPLPPASLAYVSAPSGSGRTTGAPSFAPGETVAGRYRVVRFIGRGGMGEVYEVEDLELHERVALKAIRPDIAQDSRSIARFKREAQLARKVTHPNVCRIFDMGLHHPPATGEAPGIPFLTMELLHGETLAERLQRIPRLTPAEALPIVLQLSQALDAAHRAGVVHRDFKTGNVILVPPKAPGEQERAVITDFGLARNLVEGESLTESLSVTGHIAGTPTYMAPEQVEGCKVTAAADIYALGVAMYRMLTGTWPFEADTPLASALKRLREPPRPPRDHLPDIDPLWEGVIMRCLARNPADRFAGAREVAAALTGDASSADWLSSAVTTVIHPLPESVWKRRRTWILAAAALLLVLVPVVWWKSLPPPRPVPGPKQNPAVASRRSVAVFTFRNLSRRPDSEWLGTALAEMIRTELAAAGKLRLIAGENVARTMVELSLKEPDTLAADTLQRIRTNLGTDLVVFGSYLSLGESGGGRIRLDLRVQDAATGETVASIHEEGLESGIFDVVSRAGVQLRERLGLAGITPGERQAVLAALPSDPEAVRLYAQGLAQLRQFDAKAARESLEKAVAREPGHPAIHAALAEAWQALGYDARAEAEAKKAVDLSAPLDREQRLQIEARYEETARHWSKAMELYRTLWVFYPDNLDYGLRLASVQVSAGQGKEALASVVQLRSLPAPADADPRIDLVEAAAAGSLGDYARQIKAAGEAVRRGSASGARLLVARGRLLEASALRDTGRLQPAREAAAAARAIYADTADRVGQAQTLRLLGIIYYDQGDRARAREMFQDTLKISREIGNLGGVATALGNLAILLRREGDLAGAMKLYQESLAILQEIDDKAGIATAYNNMGNLTHAQGDFTGARKLYEQALALYRETGSRDGEALILNNLATVCFDQGDLDTAAGMYEQSLATRQTIGDKPGMAQVLGNLGAVEMARGRLAEAKARYQQSLAMSRETSNKSQEAQALFDLGEISLAEGDLAAARRNHEQVRHIRTDIGEQADLAYSDLALAGVALEEGKAGEAEILARRAAGAFRQQESDSDATTALAQAARACLAQGQPARAEACLAEARPWQKDNPDRDSRARFAIAEARTAAASGRTAAARRQLETVLAEARKSGLVLIEMDASLALGKIELAAGDTAAGIHRLQALQQDASTRGFILLARKAEAALRPGGS